MSRQINLKLRWVGEPTPRWPPEKNRTTSLLYVGSNPNPVGMIFWWAWPQKRDLRWRFSWSCNLSGRSLGSDFAPGGTPTAETRTFEQARAELEEVVRDWFEKSLGESQDG